MASVVRDSYNSRTYRVRFLAIAIASLGLATHAEAMPTYSQIVAFGDSYSESGNIGRSTDAENWLEYLASDLDVLGGITPSLNGGSNYSLGTATVLGAGMLDFQAQLNAYRVPNPVADPDALYVLWLGFNDILGAENDIDLVLHAEQVADGIAAGIETLSDSGGRHFLVANAWDINTTPFSTAFETAARRDQNRVLHTLFNESLTSVLGGLEYPIHHLDAFGLSQEIWADPEGFGFIDDTSVCAASAVDCEGLVWRDLIHPTSASHRILATRALAAIPEPSTALLIGIGLTVLATRGARRS
jgi:phospholipase/lecithinase/hemolysin